MDPRALLLAATLVAVALAGCADDAPPAPVDPDIPSADKVEKGKGVIRGVVIDASITPVPDATVSVQSTDLEATTDDDGAFLFVDVEPGTYFLSVSKPGWNSIQQNVEVPPDIKAPPVVKVQLQVLPGTQPYAETQSQEGFIQCSYGTPALYGSCATEDERNRLHFAFDGIPTAVQVEIVWDSTQPSSDNMYVINAICPTEDCPGPDGDTLSGFPDRFEEGTRTSPTYSRANETFIDERDLPNGGVVAVDLSADGPALATGAALDQPFTAYVTFFYNIPEPDPEWVFIEDGAYVA